MATPEMQAPKSVPNTISANYFPQPLVRRMVLKTKVKELEALKRSAPNQNKEMIQHVINLYQGKKIPNYKTAENVVLRLSNTTKHKGIQERALKDYKATVAKYADALPTTGKLARSIEEKQRKVGTRIGSITLILFRRANEGDAEATVNVQGIGGEAQKKYMRKPARRSKTRSSGRAPKPSENTAT